MLLGTVAQTFRFPFRVFRDDPGFVGAFQDVSWVVETDAIWEIQFIPETGDATLEILDLFLYSDDS